MVPWIASHRGAHKDGLLDCFSPRIPQRWSFGLYVNTEPTKMVFGFVCHYGSHKDGLLIVPPDTKGIVYHSFVYRDSSLRLPFRS